MKKRTLKLLKSTEDFKLYEVSYPMRSTKKYAIQQRSGTKWRFTSRVVAPRYDQSCEFNTLESAESSFTAFNNWRAKEEAEKKWMQKQK